MPPLYHLYPRIRREHFEYLAHVDLGGTVCKATVTEHGAERPAASNLFYDALRDVPVETGDQVSVIVGMNGAAVYFLGLMLHGERKAPLKNAAEKQIQVSAVFPDVGFKTGEHLLVIFINA